MDEHAKIPPGAHREAVRPRRDGHRDPRAARRRRRDVLPLGARGRGAVARRSVGRRARRRAEHARHQRAAALGQRRRQARAYLPKLAADTVGAYALSEAGSGSDAFAMATRAVERGDDFVLTGRKLWITNAQRSGPLHRVRERRIPTPATAASRRSSSSAASPGSRVGKKEDKLGIRASSTCELLLEDCRVPRANVLGEVGKGYKVAIETLNEGRIGIGAQMIGLAQGALDHAIALHAGAQAVRQGDRRVPGRAVPARARGDRGRGGAAAGLQRGAAARRAASRSSPKRRCASCSRRRSPSARRRSR